MAEFRLDGVSKRFGDTHAVDGIDLTVPAGTWSGVGSGVASTIYNWDGVEEISVISSSRIFFGGSPALASAVSGTEGLVKWDGTTVSAVSGGFGGDKRVNALAQFGGELYVGGQFDSVAGGTMAWYQSGRQVETGE